MGRDPQHHWQTLSNVFKNFYLVFFRCNSWKLSSWRLKVRKKKSAIDFDFNLWDKQITVPFSGFGSHMNMNKCANNFPKIQLQNPSPAIAIHSGSKIESQKSRPSDFLFSLEICYVWCDVILHQNLFFLRFLLQQQEKHLGLFNYLHDRALKLEKSSKMSSCTIKLK